MANNEEYSKTKDKEEIDIEVEKFLKKGGKIETLRKGMGADEYHQRDPSKPKAKRFGR
jgi:hypothetical protein